MASASLNARAENVLLICVDTLRADHMSIYGYERATTPHIDNFFGEGTVYENAYSTEASTSPSVMSLLTGLLPQNHGVRLHFQKLEPSIITVPERLRQEGYLTGAVVSNMVLTAEATALDREFDHYDDYVDQRWPDRDTFERDAGATTDAALKWLATLEGEQPHFLYVHYMDPHGPYLPPDDKPVDFTHDEPKPIDVEKLYEYQRFPGIDDGLEYVDRYDEEIAYTDQEINRLLREYERLGFLDEALVILTADHGESMMEHEEWFTHGYHVYQELVHVPLLVRGPGFGPARVETPVSHMDAAPTIYAFAGIDFKDPLDAVALSQDPTPRPVYFEATTYLQRRGMRDGVEKHVVEVRQKEDTWGNFIGSLFGANSIYFQEKYRYNLELDPEELEKVAWEETPRSAAFLKLIKADPDPAGVPAEYAEGMKITSPKVAPTVDEETRKKLKALGYVQ